MREKERVYKSHCYCFMGNLFIAFTRMLVILKGFNNHLFSRRACRIVVTGFRFTDTKSRADFSCMP